VAGFMQAGQVHDAIAEQGIFRGCGGDIAAELGGVRQNENVGAAFAIDHDGLRFAVESTLPIGPMDADLGALWSGGFFEMQHTSGGCLPGFQSPFGKLGIFLMAGGLGTRAGFDVIAQIDGGSQARRGEKNDGASYEYHGDDFTIVGRV